MSAPANPHPTLDAAGLASELAADRPVWVLMVPDWMEDFTPDAREMLLEGHGIRRATPREIKSLADAVARRITQDN